MPPDETEAFRALAELGICVTDPPTPELPHAARAHVGDVPDVPVLTPYPWW